MTEQNREWAWAAGLYEGEGTVTKSKNGTTYTISMGMTDEDVVRRFHQVIGCGKVYGPYQPKRQGSKPFWRWSVSDKKGTLRFAERVLGWLGQRRQTQLNPVLARARRIEGRCDSRFDN